MLSVFLLVFPGVASLTEGTGAGATIGERLSRKRRTEGEFGLVGRTLGSARPTQRAAQPAGTNMNTVLRRQDCHSSSIVHKQSD